MPALPLTQQELDDAKRLKDLFVAWQRSHKTPLGARPSQEFAAGLLGFGQSALSQYLNGAIPLNIEAGSKFAKLLKCQLADFSPTLAEQAANYVASSEGRDMSEIDGLEDAQRVTVGNQSADVIPVRLVNLRVQAGFPRFDADEIFDERETVDLPRSWVEKHQLVPNCLLAIRVRGDSMEPVMSDGEKIIINIADTKLVSNHIYAINYDGSAVVKQMVYRNREWWLHSFNSADEFRPLMAKSGNAQVIGKVVATPFRSFIGKF